MVQRRSSLIDPPIEELLDKVDSKFTLVSLSAKRARQINSYYNQLGEGLGVVVPPQVTSVSGKPLTIAFEEIAAAKASYHLTDPEADSEGAGVDLQEVPSAEDAASQATAESDPASAEDGSTSDEPEGD